MARRVTFDQLLDAEVNRNRKSTIPAYLKQFREPERRGGARVHRDPTGERAVAAVSKVERVTAQSKFPYSRGRG